MKRHIKYFYNFIDSNGNIHAGINSYDNVLGWITFVSDYMFTPEELKHW